MQANKTVIINGRMYDAVTGLPVESKPAASAVVSKSTPNKSRDSRVAASAVHTTTQRSQTLNRRAAKKANPITKRPQPGRHMDIARSGNIARFASHPHTEEKKTVSTPDSKPTSHPVATRALARTSQKPQPSLTAKQIKNAAIASALAKPATKPAKNKRFTFKWSRRFTVLSAIFSILIIGAAITYINLPALSVGFASAQAGINASYPEYLPDGYQLHQPVTYNDGEVTLKFTSNSSDGSYTISQTRSSWDSSAVLDNVVKKAAGDNYITTQERGLTIYSYDKNAVWVNGGILYSITSNALLSGEQIRHIATSL